jgi:hypothetical protein
MVKYTSVNQTLKDLCLKLAHFVLTNNYIECGEAGRLIIQPDNRDSNGDIVFCCLHSNLYGMVGDSNP